MAAATIVLSVATTSGLPVGAGATTAITTVTISESSNNETVSVHVGDHVVVRLHSTYWTISNPTPSVLAKLSSSTIAGGVGCPKIPGMGCGVVSTTFRALRVATVKVSAHRSTCGEALRCTGTEGRWTAKIKIVKR